MGPAWPLLIVPTIFVGADTAVPQDFADVAVDDADTASAPLEMAIENVESAAFGLQSDPQGGVVYQIEQAAAGHFGSMNSWRFNVNSAIGVQVDDSNNNFGLAGVGFSYFVIDHVSLEFELNGMHIDQVGDDPWGVNMAFLMRWHFLCNDAWSLYADGGAGMLFTTHNVPEDGSSFNFTPQFGVGLSLALSRDVRLLTGVRWHHISNANTYSFNPGRDSLELYAGLSFPF